MVSSRFSFESLDVWSGSIDFFWVQQLDPRGGFDERRTRNSPRKPCEAAGALFWVLEGSQQTSNLRNISGIMEISLAQEGFNPVRWRKLMG